MSFYTESKKLNCKDAIKLRDSLKYKKLVISAPLKFGRDHFEEGFCIRTCDGKNVTDDSQFAAALTQASAREGKFVLVVGERNPLLELEITKNAAGKIGIMYGGCEVLYVEENSPAATAPPRVAGLP